MDRAHAGLATQSSHTFGAGRAATMPHVASVCVEALIQAVHLQNAQVWGVHNAHGAYWASSAKTAAAVAQSQPASCKQSSGTTCTIKSGNVCHEKRVQLQHLWHGGDVWHTLRSTCCASSLHCGAATASRRPRGSRSISISAPPAPRRRSSV